MSVYGIYQKHLDSKGQSCLCMVWNLSYFPTVDVTLYEVEHLDKISNWSYALVEDRLFVSLFGNTLITPISFIQTLLETKYFTTCVGLTYFWSLIIYFCCFNFFYHLFDQKLKGPIIYIAKIVLWR